MGLDYKRKLRNYKGAQSSAAKKKKNATNESSDYDESDCDESDYDESDYSPTSDSSESIPARRKNRNEKHVVATVESEDSSESIESVESSESVEPSESNESKDSSESDDSYDSSDSFVVHDCSYEGYDGESSEDGNHLYGRGLIGKKDTIDRKRYQEFVEMIESNSIFWDEIWATDFGKFLHSVIVHVFSQCGHGGPSIVAGKEILEYFQYNATRVYKLNQPDMIQTRTINHIIKDTDHCYQCKMKRRLSMYLVVPSNLIFNTPGEHNGKSVLYFGAHCWERMMTIYKVVNYIAYLKWGQKGQVSINQYKYMMQLYGNIVSAQKVMRDAYH